MANDLNEKNVPGGKMKLDDAQRVKVLSPGMMVAKRFFRNKLAIVGLVIIICMFLFSFLGGAIMPYSQSDVFYRTDMVRKDYAGATYIKDFQMMAKEGEELPSDVYSKCILAVGTDKLNFTTSNKTFICLEKIDDDTYIFYKGKVPNEKNEMGMLSKLSFTSYNSSDTLSYAFCRSAAAALSSGDTEITVDGNTFRLVKDGEGSVTVNDASGTPYAYVSDMSISASANNVALSPDFKIAVKDAVAAGSEEFVFADADGTETEYTITRQNEQYLIKRVVPTRVIDTYSAPSAEHPFGTDGNGMDMLARLMYGGRVSLLIGFVVMAIEVVLGAIVGGIAGFFGGWVDNLLMRFVDVVYCIPSLPLYMILGSIMDYMHASATARIYILCIVMGIIGWVGIARIVRGQILSLREQEFMVAAEATGLSVGRRIFKHLLPNVVPQLIVFATMILGDVILSEATLSFLGLGIKYPAASWGSIINAVNDSYVMTNYLFVWVPAGILILLTVLAFNFIGDGLRDAFDPKMKR